MIWKYSPRVREQEDLGNKVNFEETYFECDADGRAVCVEK